GAVWSFSEVSSCRSLHVLFNINQSRFFSHTKINPLIQGFYSKSPKIDLASNITVQSKLLIIVNEACPSFEGIGWLRRGSFLPRLGLRSFQLKLRKCNETKTD